MRAYDPEALKELMRRRHVTQTALSVYLGESLGAVNCKCRGVRDWWLWEVQAIICYLRLEAAEVDRVFFAGGGRGA